MKIINLQIALIGIAFVLNVTSCTKFLEAKSDSSLSTSQTLEDVEAIIDNYALINRGVTFINDPADEYYYLTELWNSFPNPYKDLYVWDPRVENRVDWTNQYLSVLYANTVLDNLKNIDAGDQLQKWNHLKGSALFYRANGFYQITQLYAKPYNKATAGVDLGIPLRLSSDFNIPSKRGTLQQTYDRIIQDLQDALPLLPETPSFKTRPGKPAALGLLARAYLQIGDYAKALEAANTCLQIENVLMDYNSLDTTSTSPFTLFNKEVILYTRSSGLISSSYAKTDSVLFQSYNENDLRKILFFQDHGDGTVHFKGSYNGLGFGLFQGIATDEIFLIRAECYARSGNTSAALDDLNALLVNRWKTGTFVPLTAENSDEALLLVFQERKKELVARGIRWSDIRRLNTEERFAITLKRVIDGETYTLPPNDPRFALLIPADVISRSDIEQNER